MSDCSELINQLNAINQKLQKLSELERRLSLTEDKTIELAAAIGFAVISVNQLKGTVTAIGWQVGSATVQAQAAKTLAGNVAGSVAPIITGWPGIVAGVATIGAVGLTASAAQKRADSAYNLANSSFLGANKAADLAATAILRANEAKGTADVAIEQAQQAYGQSSTAIGVSQQASSRADNALSVAEQAKQLANIAAAKSDRALSIAAPLPEQVADIREIANQANQNAKDARVEAGLAYDLAEKSMLAANYASDRAATAIIRAEEAKEEARQSETRSGLALSTANQAQGTATQAQSTATQAQTTATQAQTTATQAQATATQAQATATTAQTTATQAQATATTAQTTATQAQSTATQVKSTATQAQSTATQARNTATQAQNTATQAQSAVTQSATQSREGFNNLIPRIDQLELKSVAQGERIETVATGITRVFEPIKAQTEYHSQVIPSIKAQTEYHTQVIPSIKAQTEYHSQVIPSIKAQTEYHGQVIKSIPAETKRFGPEIQRLSTQGDINTRSIANQSNKIAEVEATAREASQEAKVLFSRTETLSGDVKLYSNSIPVIQAEATRAFQAAKEAERKAANTPIEALKVATSAANTAINAERKADLALETSRTPVNNLSPNQLKEVSREVEKEIERKIPLEVQREVSKEIEKVNDQQTTRIINEIQENRRQIGAIPNILSQSQNFFKSISAAASEGVCNTTKPDGCLGKKFGNLDQKLNGLNALLNAFQAATMQPILNKVSEINSKLGNAIPGGIGKWITNIGDIVNRSQILNIITWIAVLHNAYFLSNSLTQTLFSAVSNGLAALGIKDTSTNPEGSPLDIGKIVNQWTEGFFKSIFGVQFVDGIKADWKKYSRIYQSAANLLFSIQSISHSILGALEVVGNWVASIGNALQKWRNVGERAYSWMNPQPNFQNRFFTGLQNASEMVSQIDQIASEVLSTQETISEISKNKDELFKSMGETDDGKKSDKPPEAAKVKADEDKSKADSKSPSIQEADQIKQDPIQPTN